MEYVFTLAYEKLFAQGSRLAPMLHPANAIANMHAFISKSMAMHVQQPAMTNLFALAGPVAEDVADYLSLAVSQPCSAEAKRSKRMLLNPAHYVLDEPEVLQLKTEFKISTMENICKLMEEHWNPALRMQQLCVMNVPMQQQITAFSGNTIAAAEKRKARQGI
jgi:hypothetical protein